PFTAELFARDLSELLDHFGWQNAIIAGCSMGGCVAQALGGLHPARAGALALIDTTAWYGENAIPEWRERANLVRSKGFAAMSGFQAARWFGESFRASHPEAVKALMDVFVANDMDCYAATCALLGSADLRPHLASLRMPVAVIVGDEDYAT